MGLIGAVGGALAGGYAAIRGAREAAERAAQGALAQAEQQAKDQHSHWLRQERRTVYRECVRQSHAYVRAVVDLRSALRTSDAQGTGALRQQCLDTYRQLFNTQLETLMLCGPLTMRASAALGDGFRLVHEYLRQDVDLDPDHIKELLDAAVPHLGTLNGAIATELQITDGGPRWPAQARGEGVTDTHGASIRP
ncbi:hypothetical protein GCM10010321_77250 [Streptomyces chartreusis]|nr:hypothetical protein GCM10010321_77250 [Streptomyces chartreusis]